MFGTQLELGEERAGLAGISRQLPHHEVNEWFTARNDTASLIDYTNVYTRSHAPPPCVKRQPPKQSPEQRGLSGAVRPTQRDTIACIHRQANRGPSTKSPRRTTASLSVATTDAEGPASSIEY